MSWIIKERIKSYVDTRMIQGKGECGALSVYLPINDNLGCLYH